MSWFKYVLKASYAGVVAFLGSMLTAVQAGSLNFAAWLTIALTTVIAVGGVFGFQNGPHPHATEYRRRASDTFVPSA